MNRKRKSRYGRKQIIELKNEIHQLKKYSKDFWIVEHQNTYDIEQQRAYNEELKKKLDRFTRLQDLQSQVAVINKLNGILKFIIDKNMISLEDWETAKAAPPSEKFPLHKWD